MAVEGGKKAHDLFILLGRYRWKELSFCKNTSLLVFWGQCVSFLTQASAKSRVMVNYGSLMQFLPFVVFFVSILTVNDHYR